MKHFPLAPEERGALLAALQRCGLSPRQVCVSRLDSRPPGQPDLALVSSPAWVGVYETSAGWIRRLEQDLVAASRERER